MKNRRTPMRQRDMASFGRRVPRFDYLKLKLESRLAPEKDPDLRLCLNGRVEEQENATVIPFPSYPAVVIPEK